MSDKPVEAMTRDELEKLATAFRHIQVDAVRRLGEVLAGWHEVPEAQRRDRVLRAMSPLLINPWPLPNAELENLRERLMARLGP